MFAFGETIKRLRSVPGGYDENGDPVAGTTSSVTYDGVAVAPRVGGPGTSSTEIIGRGRAGVIEGFTVYGPIDMDIAHTDQIEWRGQVYDVEGEPGRWANPYSGRQAGMEVAIRRAEG